MARYAQSPCKDCDGHSITCHTTCEVYKAFSNKCKEHYYNGPAYDNYDTYHDCRYAAQKLRKRCSRYSH